MSGELTRIKEELVETIHFLHAQGWAPATSSNYSCKEAGTDAIWISASGLDKGHFSVGDLIRIDAQGNPGNDPRKTSAETLLHTLIYQMYPATRCILHTHSLLNNVVSKVHEAAGEVIFEGNELQKAISGCKSHETPVSLPIFSNSQDMVELSARIHRRLSAADEVPGFLLAAHGLYAWGSTIQEAKRHIEAFEYLIAYTYHLKTYTH